MLWLQRWKFAVLVTALAGCGDDGDDGGAGTGSNDDACQSLCGCDGCPQTGPSNGSTSTSGASDSTTADGTGGGGAAPDLTCEGSTPILQPDGQPSGFEECPNGLRHRVAALACTVPDAPETCENDPDLGQAECAASAECTAAPHGACLNSGIGGGAPDCQCRYGCETDADCGAGEICACGGPVGARPQCVPSACTTDADCGPGGLCTLEATVGACGGTFYRMACLTPASECSPAGSCPEDPDFPGCEPPCVIAGDAWVCDVNACAPSSCG